MKGAEVSQTETRGGGERAHPRVWTLPVREGWVCLAGVTLCSRLPWPPPKGKPLTEWTLD